MGLRRVTGYFVLAGARIRRLSSPVRTGRSSGGRSHRLTSTHTRSTKAESPRDLSLIARNFGTPEYNVGKVLGESTRMVPKNSDTDYMSPLIMGSTVFV